MKICFMVTGLLRCFYKELFVFLKELSKIAELDLYIHTTKQCYDVKFQSDFDDTHLANIINADFCRHFTIDNSRLSEISHYSQREQNVFYQWKKVYECFQSIPTNTYDYIIRIRPDAKLQVSPIEFMKSLSKFEKNTLYIPYGNDLSSVNMKNTSGLNDQIAIGDYNTMKKYCSLYLYLQEHFQETIVSEILLNSFLKERNVTIERFNLDYKLHLSDCSILAICGNSGAGKSRIVDALQKIFPYDSSLVIETDSYHKWERESKHWKEYTHLNPNANNLEKLADDTYHLKMGNSVELVEYDHTTGKFSQPFHVKGKHLVFLCGLHTLYKDNMRSLLDFKLYIDVEERLNTYWKVKRDMMERGYSVEKILQTIERRKKDYTNYILPQKMHADCILEISYQGEITDYTKTVEDTLIEYRISIKPQYVLLLNKLLLTFSTSHIYTESTVTYQLEKSIPTSTFLEYIHQEKIHIQDARALQPDYLGVLQIMILLLTFK